MPRLLNNQTINGDGDIIDWNGNENTGSIQLCGVWDGAIVTIKGSLNRGVTFLPINTGVFDADEMAALYMSPGKLKATISEAGPLTKLNCYVSPG